MLGRTIRTDLGIVFHLDLVCKPKKQTSVCRKAKEREVETKKKKKKVERPKRQRGADVLVIAGLF